MVAAYDASPLITPFKMDVVLALLPLNTWNDKILSASAPCRASKMLLLLSPLPKSMILSQLLALPKSEIEKTVKPDVRSVKLDWFDEMLPYLPSVKLNSPVELVKVGEPVRVTSDPAKLKSFHEVPEPEYDNGLPASRYRIKPSKSEPLL